MNSSPGKRTSFTIEIVVCALVTAAFTNIYLTQPILPVLQQEFEVSTVQASFTVSFVILGIVLSNLVFGYLSDKVSIRPILIVGGSFVAIADLVCAATGAFPILVGARLVQGLFIPALTTSLAAWMAKNLPQERLPVVMGTYVSSTVLGGLGGRLLGGWIHPPLHWRYAFITAALLIGVATLSAVLILSGQKDGVKHEGDAGLGGESKSTARDASFFALLQKRELFFLFLCGAAGFLMFSSVFNYLPYRLSNPPFDFTTEKITMIYLVYIMGIFLGPVAGRLSNRFGGGNTLIMGSLGLVVAFIVLLIPAVWAVIVSLLVLCAGFFTIHATAVGLLNRKLSSSQGRANALYVLFYYVGGWTGITMAGLCYDALGWNAMLLSIGAFVFVPLFVGIKERKQ